LLRKREGRGGGKGNFLSGSDRNPEEFISELKNIICEKAIQLHGDENGSD
jgi:alanyl-tRNA synthetase